MIRWVKRIIIALVIVAGAGFLWWQTSSGNPVVILKGSSFKATILRTDAELQKGLSDTDSLGKQEVMLFVFHYDSKWSIWMKDMNYPIDVVWLNQDHKIVHMVRDAQPSSYPSTRFTPDENARYVIELSSGTIERTGISIGDSVDLPSGI